MISPSRDSGNHTASPTERSIEPDTRQRRLRILRCAQDDSTNKGTRASAHPFRDEAAERMGQRRRMRKRFLVGAFIVL